MEEFSMPQSILQIVSEKGFDGLREILEGVFSKSFLDTLFAESFQRMYIAELPQRSYIIYSVRKIVRSDNI